MFVFESEPGTAVSHLQETDEGVAFTVEGPKDAQITLQCEPETDYDVIIGMDIIMLGEFHFDRVDDHHVFSFNIQLQ